MTVLIGPPSTSRLTRKLSGDKPPDPHDHTAWRLDQNGWTEVFRSPRDPDVWLSREERERIIMDMIGVNGPYKSHGGFALISDPQEGTVAWFNADRHRRTQKVLRNGRWIPLMRFQGEYVEISPSSLASGMAEINAQP